LERKIKVGAVSYLNTKPLVYGFEHGMMKDEIDLVMEYPSKIASMLMADEIDVGLVPVSVIPALKEYYIISDYCISSDGEVASVCLFSDVPLQNIQTILLDYQSRTSVELLKILIKDFWKIDPEIKMTSQYYQGEIQGTTAGLVIGDRAFAQRKISKNIFDLGLEWKKFTGLPFVFAAWISNKKLDENFIKSFNEANSKGLQNIDDIVVKNPFPLFDLKAYYSSYINYILDENKRSAMRFFLEKSSHLILN
jgi:chorismate dehydratase